MAVPSSMPGPIKQGEIFDSTVTPAHDGSRYEGVEWVVADYDFTNRKLRSEKSVRLRLVKNNSGISIKGKRPVRLDATGTQIVGYARLGTGAAGAEKCYPTDEWLPSTGIPNGSWGIIVVEGPAIVKTGESPVAAGLISAGTLVICQTAAASTAGSTQLAGVESIVSATSVKALDMLGFLGRAISAATSANTNTDLLVHVGELN